MNKVTVNFCGVPFLLQKFEESLDAVFEKFSVTFSGFNLLKLTFGDVYLFLASVHI